MSDRTGKVSPGRSSTPCSARGCPGPC
eukprot:ctg_2384.g508